MSLWLLAWLIPASLSTLDNDYVRISRDEAPCASAQAPECGDRVIVALGDIELTADGSKRKLARGDIAVFGRDATYATPSGGSFFEVAIKPNHPAVHSPAEIIAADLNTLLYDGAEFFIFEEKLAPGETRPRHSHSQRVVIQLNRARLQQWPDGKPPILVETVPDRANFSPPVIHTVKNIGEVPLRGIIVEFKPSARSALLR